LTVPWNSKGFCHSEAVFRLKFVSMSRIDVRLVGERRAFQEGLVTIVSSTEPTRRKRSAIQESFSRRGGHHRQLNGANKEKEERYPPFC